MALTASELQSVTSSVLTAVLSSIRTNSRTIEQLSAVTNLSDEDCFEIGGGKKVSYGVIRSIIEKLSAKEHDELKTLIKNNELKSVEIIVSEKEGTLTINSVGKTISVSIPVDINGGLATLDERAELSADQRPDELYEVLEFDGFIDSASITQNSASTDRLRILFVTSTSCFVAAPYVSSGGSVTKTYYANWHSGRRYGTVGASGVAPSQGKIYIDRTTNIQYRFDGSELIMLSKPLEIGEEEGTAYDGGAGAALARNVTSIEGRVTTTTYKADSAFKAFRQLNKQQFVKEINGISQASDHIIVTITRANVDVEKDNLVTSTGGLSIQAATNEKAGVMTSKDKEHLDSINIKSIPAEDELLLPDFKDTVLEDVKEDLKKDLEAAIAENPSHYLGIPVKEMGSHSLPGATPSSWLEPNILYRWGEVNALSINLLGAVEGHVAEYMFEFVSGAVPTNLSLPASVQFPYEVEIEANMRYQVSIENNIALIAGVEITKQ